MQPLLLGNQTPDHLLSKVDRLLLAYCDRNTPVVTTDITHFLAEGLTHHIQPDGAS